MSFGIDNITDGGFTANLGLAAAHTFNHTCGANANKLMVHIGTGVAGDAVANATITYNSVPLTRVANGYDGAFEGSGWFRLNSPPIGTFQVSITIGAAISNVDIGAAAISFVDALATEGTPAALSISDGGANRSLAISSAIGDIVLAGFASDLGADGATTADQTLVAEQEDVDADNDFSAQYKVAVGTSTTMSWTHAAPSAGFSMISGIAIKPLLNPPLAIALQPADVNVVNGQSAAFKVQPSGGTGVTHYQWKKNGSNVGSDQPTYALSTASTDNRALITCDVSDDLGTVVSRSARLTLSWHDVYLYSVPEDSDPDDVRLRDPTAATAAGGPHSINPNGVASTVAAGTVALNGSIKPVSVTSTAATGTVGVNSSIKPVGDVRTNNTGTIALNGTIKPVGVATTTAAGTIALRGTIAAAGVASAAATGTVGLRAQVNPVGNLRTNNTGTVALNGSIKPAGDARTNNAGTVALNGVIKPDGVASTCATGTPTLDVGHQIQPTGVPSTCATGTVSLRGTIAPVGVASAAATGTVGLRGQIGAVGNVRTNNTGTIALNGSIRPVGVPSSAATGHPTLDVDHFIHPNGVASTCATGTPTVGDGHVPPPAQQVEYGGGHWPDTKPWSRAAVAGRHVIGMLGDFPSHGTGLVTILHLEPKPKRRSREVREAEMLMLETL